MPSRQQTARLELSSADARCRSFQALRKEYLRIAQTTEFNGKKLFDGNNGEMTLQAGYGVNGQVGASIGGKMGTGGFANQTGYDSGIWTRSATIGDLNGDGILDIVATNGTGSINLLFGNGDGSFVSQTGLVVDNWAECAVIGDVNGDG